FGDTAFGASGGRGTNGLVSAMLSGFELLHLRSNCCENQSKIQAEACEKKLCSCCERSDGLVQFDDPKITVPCPRRSTLFWWFIPACAGTRIGIPAAHI